MSSCAETTFRGSSSLLCLRSSHSMCHSDSRPIHKTSTTGVASKTSTSHPKYTTYAPNNFTNKPDSIVITSYVPSLGIDPLNLGVPCNNSVRYNPISTMDIVDDRCMKIREIDFDGDSEEVEELMRLCACGSS